MAIIEVHNVVKEYRTATRREGLWGAIQDLFVPRSQVRRAVDDVSFSIHQGEAVAYIGANGAGKSTTIKMLTGILRPTAGSVRCLEMDPLKDRSRYVHHIGVVFGQRTQLWWDIAVIEAFRLLGRMYGVSASDLKERIRQFSALLDLEPLLHQPVRKLSLGQRMRCDLAASLLHRPSLVFLDEPTIGLDVDVKERVREFVKEIHLRDGITVILTTHDLRDVEELCERVILVDEGKVLFDGALVEFRRRYAKERRALLDLHRPEDREVAVAVLRGLPVRTEWREPARVAVWFDPEVVSPARVLAAALEGPPLLDLSMQEPDLADVVRDVYRHQQEQKTGQREET